MSREPFQQLTERCLARFGVAAPDNYLTDEAASADDRADREWWRRKEETDLDFVDRVEGFIAGDDEALTAGEMEELAAAISKEVKPHD